MGANYRGNTNGHSRRNFYGFYFGIRYVQKYHQDKRSRVGITRVPIRDMKYIGLGAEFSELLLRYSFDL